MSDDLIGMLLERGEFLPLALLVLYLAIRQRGDRRTFVSEAECAKRCPKQPTEAEGEPPDQDQ
jgi:hypothetical protein